MCAGFIWIGHESWSLSFGEGSRYGDVEEFARGLALRPALNAPQLTWENLSTIPDSKPSSLPKSRLSSLKFVNR